MTETSTTPPDPIPTLCQCATCPLRIHCPKFKHQDAFTHAAVVLELLGEFTHAVSEHFANTADPTLQENKAPYPDTLVAHPDPDASHPHHR